ncbi:MAG: Beta-ketoacyl synthase [Rhizobacter sp.]|nr:Beta-ketoacyl synthase [Rhizobacter sp.]
MNTSTLPLSSFSIHRGASRPPGVAVTGVGVVSPHGHHATRMFEALMRGQSAASQRTAQAIHSALRAEADFEPFPWLTRLEMTGADRKTQMAVVAAKLAFLDAHVMRWTDPERVGLFCGYSPPTRPPARDLPGFGASALTPAASAAHIAKHLGVHGPVVCECRDDAASAIAITHAAAAIQRGEIDVALCGGTHALQADCAPPNGVGLCGEGAAFLMLESTSHAARRARVCCIELAGSGIRSASPGPGAENTWQDSLSRAMQAALADALEASHLAAADVGYCNADGAADAATECHALREVWGDDQGSLRVSATKALHGDLHGGAGALEAAITVMALHRRAVPPTVGRPQPRCACGLNHVVRIGVPMPQLHAAISNSFASGGTHAVLAFRRIDGPAFATARG